MYLEIFHIDEKDFVEMMIELYLIWTGVDGSHVVGVRGLGDVLMGVPPGMKPLANRFNKVIYFGEVKFDVLTFFYLTRR